MLELLGYTERAPSQLTGQALARIRGSPENESSGPVNPSTESNTPDLSIRSPTGGNAGHQGQLELTLEGLSHTPMESVEQCQQATGNIQTVSIHPAVSHSGRESCEEVFSPQSSSIDGWVHNQEQDVHDIRPGPPDFAANFPDAMDTNYHGDLTNAMNTNFHGDLTHVDTNYHGNLINMMNTNYHGNLINMNTNYHGDLTGDLTDMSNTNY
jgi:hypothetical protein